MNKKFLIIASLLLFFSAFVLTGCTKQADNPEETASLTVGVSADKIEVVHFHATQQCWSCITVGEYALKTITEKFPEEYQNGTITFKDINAELPENSAIVAKYQARGSSLFINAITNGQDNIEEDTKVWRLVSDETQYLDYFETKLNSFLKK